MAAATRTTTTKHTTKPKRRKHHETTISSSAVAATTHGRALNKSQVHINRRLDKPTVVSLDKTSWCCPSSKPYPSNHEIRFCSPSPSPEMDLTSAMNCHHNELSFPSSFSKFNTALTAGLLNPMSPPPDPTRQVPTKSSPTLFEMMANEPEIVPRTTQFDSSINNTNVVLKAAQLSVQDKQALVLQRINDILGNKSPGNLFNDSMSSDVKLTLSSKDGISVSMNVHRQILVGHSRYFAMKLSDRWIKQQRGSVSSPYMVEIADCDDVEVYIETLRLMYCKDLRRKLMREDVNKVLGILKVSAAIGFDAGVLSCLEFLEAAPWSEDEEEKVASLLSELRLEGVGAGEVLKRMSVEVTNGTEENGDNEEVLLKLLKVVLDGKEERARQEMKGLVLKMLRENSSHNYLKKESLYSACDGCLQLLRSHFLHAASGNMVDAAKISRQADNLHWILDILIDRQIAEDFLKIWASQSDMSEVHSKVPAVHRYEVSRVAARLFVGIGKGQMLASKEMRFLLLQTWLVPFYDDFGWMKRASKGLDRHLIEDGLSNTILTLPLAWQQEILVAWFNRFLNSGEDCPNMQRGFEIWWRRAFCKRSGEQERTKPLRIVTAAIDNS